MNDRVQIEVYDFDDKTTELISVLATSPVIAYLRNAKGAPWFDETTGLTYRWPQ